MNKNYINQLIDFINDSPTAFQVTKNIVSELEQSGFVKLNEKEKMEP